MSSVSFAPYRRVLGNPALRRVVILGLLVRGPGFASAIVITLHVVTTLGRSYAEAGLLVTVATVAIAVSGPLRGRLLDRHGLRRVLGPGLVIAAVCWGVAPFVGYRLLLGCVAVGGFFAVPMFTIVRQAMFAQIGEDDRRSAISFDSAVLETSIIVIPALAVWACAHWGTTVVFFGVEMVTVVAGMLLWLANPPLRSDTPEPEAAVAGASTRRFWTRPSFLLVCLVAGCSTVVLAGVDLSIVAVMRDLGQSAGIGLVLAAWSVGALVGGIGYGALQRAVPSSLILLGLAAATGLMALAPTAWWLAAASVLGGLFGAPVVTATVDEIGRLVREESMGEALGWHSSFYTAGGALGAPLAGLAIDHVGSRTGFLAIAGAALLVVVLAVPTLRIRQARDEARSLVGSSRS